MIGLRTSDELRAAIDQWAARQPDKPSRSEAIRRLVELGLTVKQKGRGSDRQTRRARDMAAETIERKLDPAAPEDERALRKRRPGDARGGEVRGDQGGIAPVRQLLHRYWIGRKQRWRRSQQISVDGRSARRGHPSMVTPASGLLRLFVGPLSRTARVG